MQFTHGESVHRDRRKPEADPYNPDRTVLEADYDPTLTIVLENSFVASSSSSSLRNATRSQILTAKSLYSTDPDVDVVAGDRIRVGGVVDDLSTGLPYVVEARPAADTSPFTGWQPAVEIPLLLTEEG